MKKLSVRVKKVSVLFSLLTIVTLFMTHSAGAVLVNGGFETGDLTGWSTKWSGSYSQTIVTGVVIPSDSLYPVEGSYQAMVWAGLLDTYIDFSQSVDMGAGDMLSGYARFISAEYEYRWNDYAAVRIYDSLNNLVATPWYQDVSQVGLNTYSNWEYWFWVAPSAGTYTLNLGVENVSSAYGPSYYVSSPLFDGIKQTTVPIPGSLLLLSSGLLGLGALGWRRRQV